MDDECALKEIYIYVGSFKEGMTYSDFVAKIKTAPLKQEAVEKVFREDDKDFSGYLTTSEYADASKGDLDGDGKVYFPGSVILSLYSYIKISYWDL